MKWIVATVGSVLTVSLVAALLMAGTAHGATSGSGSDGGGTVTVGAGDGETTVGGTGIGAGGAASKGPSGASGSPGSPWTCSDQSLALNDEGFPPGGPTPGGWFSVTCIDSLTGATTTNTEWITDQTTPTPAPATVDPEVLALQAEHSLSLPRPVTHFNPSGVSVVNLPTWLWIDAEAWHSQTVSATAGTVSVTAVATPRSVSWSMGDGTVVTCKGPGIAYDTTKSSQAQVTDCEHTYTTTSAGQPTTDGKDNGNAFTVTATVAWSVAWTVTGALGGGELPDLDTSTSSTLRVEQVESINELASFRRPETVDLGRRP